ncbi:MAG: C10 family peptidase [Prevotella sp.]|nr:C10 family peptidase [Prevotella sp.]
MKKKSFILMVMAGVAAIAYAGPVSRSAARQSAEAFLAERGLGQMKASSLNIVKTAPRKGSATEAAYYVFNLENNGGYVIASGDDRTPAVLGYADSGSFDADNLPDNMRAWLQGYADQIQWMDDNGVVAAPQVKAPRKTSEGVTELAKTVIKPMVKTKWNQGAPYNNLCPKGLETSGSEYTPVTGCVATAMAQLMYYYKYPTATVAEIPSYKQKYTVNGKDTLVTRPSIPAGSVIDWDNMQETYTNSTASTPANDAVAQLMLYCGIAEEMGYGHSSGAGISPATTMPKYFGYGKCMKQIGRNTYDIDEWENILYNELANSRPLYYTGASTGGGHAFILDGYDGNGYYHVNWGWGGSSDGYFLIDILNPYNKLEAGASSSSDGFAMGQTMLVNVIPDADAPADEEEVKYRMNCNIMTFEGNNVYMNWWNLNSSPMSFEYGIGIRDAAGNIKPLMINSVTNLGVYYGYIHQEYVILPLLSEGTYDLIPISRIKGTEEWILSNVEGVFLTAVVKDGSITFSVHPIVDFTLSNFRLQSKGESGQDQLVDVDITNNGDDFTGSLQFFASQTENKGSRLSGTGAYIKHGDTETVSFFFKPTSAGTYNVWVCTDEAGTNVIGSGAVEILDANTSTSNVSLSSASIANIVENEDGNVLYGTNAKVKATVKNNTENLDRRWVLFYLYKKNTYGTYSSASSFYTQTALSPYGQNTYEHEFTGLVAEGEYRIDFRYNGMTLKSWYFTVKPGYEVYREDLTHEVIPCQSGENQVEDNVVWADFSGVTNADMEIAPNGNPNTLYVFSSSSTVPSSLDGKNVVKGNKAESITLADGYSFYAPQDISVNQISYSRVPTKGSNGTGGWETMVLPFAPTTITKAADGQELTWFKSGSEKGKNMWIKEFVGLDGSDCVVFDHVQELKANRPYIIAVPGDRWGDRWDLEGKQIVFSATNATVEAGTYMKSSTSSYDFVGTTVTTEQESVYAINSVGDAFVLSDAVVNPFAAYFVAKVSSATQPAQLRINGNGATTGIIAVEQTNSPNADDAIYNLQGQRVKSAQRGIYIQGKRKIIVK